VLATSLPLVSANPAQAQSEPVKALDASVGGFNLASVNALLAKGDAAVASGNLGQARKDYDEAREACRRLLGFYRDLSGAFARPGCPHPQGDGPEGPRSPGGPGPGQPSPGGPVPPPEPSPRWPCPCLWRSSRS
jgi:hypothetical protein